MKNAWDSVNVECQVVFFLFLFVCYLSFQSVGRSLSLSLILSNSPHTENAPVYHMYRA